MSEAIRDIARAATRCRFEAGDASSDEAVLLRILQLAETVICDPVVGRFLDDASVCEVMETGLSMCCQIRLSGKLFGVLIFRGFKKSC